MSSLQQLTYKQLPISIKKTILQNEKNYPEYNIVFTQLNKDILSSYKTRVNLNKKDITLMSILLTVYYHIKSHPPSLYIKKSMKQFRNPVNRAWDNFMRTNYPFYDDFMYDERFWPKFMFLLYYTYIYSYIAFYNLFQRDFFIDIPKFNRKKEKFISYIYLLYKYLDKNVTLNKFRENLY